MLKKIFKAGNYGKKGSWTNEDLKKMVEDGKEFSVIPGHVGDWINNGYVKTAIPTAGTVKCVEVDNEGYLIGDISYNEFGNKVTEGGLYKNFSTGFKMNGDPDHLALLGYVPPHIKDLDKAFSEFAVEKEVNYIEFGEGGNMDLAAILAALAALSTEDKLKVAIAVVEGVDATEANITGLCTLQNKLWDKQDEAWYVEKLESEGYKVAKEFSEEQVKEFAEGAGFNVVKKEPEKTQTKEEIKAEIKAEFAVEKEVEKREAEKTVLKEKFVGQFPPSMKEFAEFTVEAAYNGENYENIIEFSEEEKIPMREKLEKMTADGGPFARLFENYSERIEFSEGEGEDLTDNKARINAYNL